MRSLLSGVWAGADVADRALALVPERLSCITRNWKAA